MKKFLLISLLGVASLSPFLKGYYPEETSYYYEETTYYPENSYSHTAYSRNVQEEPATWGEILGTAVLVAGAVGLTYCALKQEPFDTLNDAQSQYDATDKKVLRLVDRYVEDNDDVEDLAASFYLRSAYPLVTLSHHLEAAHDATKNVLKKVRKALNLRDEDTFVRDCNRLQKKARYRLDRIDEVLAAVHTHPFWMNQYALYLHETHYKEMRTFKSSYDDLSWQQRRVVVVEQW